MGKSLLSPSLFNALLGVVAWGFWMIHGFPILAGNHQEGWEWKDTFGCGVCFMGALARITTALFVLFSVYTLVRTFTIHPG